MSECATGEGREKSRVLGRTFRSWHREFEGLRNNIQVHEQ